jgi:hypothetical protein
MIGTRNDLEFRRATGRFRIHLFRNADSMIKDATGGTDFREVCLVRFAVEFVLVYYQKELILELRS